MRSRIFFGSYRFATGLSPSRLKRNKYYVGGIITTRSRLRWFLTGFGLFAFGIGYNFGFETGKITF